MCGNLGLLEDVRIERRSLRQLGLQVVEDLVTLGQLPFVLVPATSV